MHTIRGLIGAVLGSVVVGALTGCTPPGPTTVDNSLAGRLVHLSIRADTPVLVPADVETAFGVNGDPERDRPLGSRCPLRSLVITNYGRHGHGDTGGLCGTPTSGDWNPLYGGVVHDPTTLDIGYVIPLAEAWRSGAADWPVEHRNGFAVDPSWERTVITLGSDRERGDRTPEAWRPPQPEQCGYATAWINAKWAWHLAITQAEHDALAAMLATCPPPTPGA